MKALAWLFTFSLLAPAGKVVNFDTYKIGQAPPGWTVASPGKGNAPDWEIRKDQTAPTQPYVLAEVSADPKQTKSPLAILNDPLRAMPMSASGSSQFPGGKAWLAGWYGDIATKIIITWRAPTRTRTRSRYLKCRTAVKFLF